MILALDLSTNVGWASFSPEAGYRSGEFEIEGKALGRFALNYSRWLAAKLADVEECFIEDMFLGKQTQALTVIKLAGLRFETARACEMRGIRCQTVELGKWRSHFIGTSQAPKPIQKAKKGPAWLKARAIEECRKRGWNPKTHNEAEALGILDFVRSKQDPTYGVDSTPLFRGAA